MIPPSLVTGQDREGDKEGERQRDQCEYRYHNYELSPVCFVLPPPYGSVPQEVHVSTQFWQHLLVQ